MYIHSAIADNETANPKISRPNRTDARFWDKATTNAPIVKRSALRIIVVLRPNRSTNIPLKMQITYQVSNIKYFANITIKWTRFHYRIDIPPVSAAMNPPTGKRLTTHSRFEQVSPRFLCICGFAPDMIPISYPIRKDKNIDWLLTKNFFYLTTKLHDI